MGEVQGEFSQWMKYGGILTMGKGAYVKYRIGGILTRSLYEVS